MKTRTGLNFVRDWTRLYIFGAKDTTDPIPATPQFTDQSHVILQTHSEILQNYHIKTNISLCILQHKCFHNKKFPLGQT